MPQLNQFAGNLALPIDGRIGFGQPGAEGDAPTGPQLMVVAGDPNGSVTAPAGTLGLDPTGPALWQNTDGSTAWEGVGGGGAPVMFHDFGGGALNTTSQVWVLDGAVIFTVPVDGDGDYWVLYEGEALRPAGGGSSQDRRMEVGVSVDGADPISDNRRYVTPGTGATTDPSTVLVTAKLTGLVAGQIVQGAGRKAPGADVVGGSIVRRALSVLKVA